MKNFLLSLLLLPLLLVGCDFMNAEPAQKMGFIDTARILKESLPSEAGNAFLQNMGQLLEKELAEAKESLKSNPEDKVANQYVVNTHAFLKKRLQVEQQNVINQLNRAIGKHLEAYRLEHNLSHIVSTGSTLAYDKKLDITDEIIKIINKENIVFSPITSSQNAPKYEPAKEEVVEEKAVKEEKKGK